MMEQVLGIQPTGAGFSTVVIRPDLVDLDWAKGGEPTPHGLLKVDVRKGGGGMAVAVDVPEGVVAHVSVPVTLASAHVTVNGGAATAASAENGTRAIVTLDHPGHYQVAGQ
jgi:hypothetical protein